MLLFIARLKVETPRIAIPTDVNSFGLSFILINSPLFEIKPLKIFFAT